MIGLPTVIALVLTIGFIGLAKRGRGRKRRRMGRYIRGGVDESLVLTTIGARALLKISFDETVNERTLVSSVVATYALDDLTEGAGIGPIMVGLAHDDYTAAEIEEFIENTGSWDEGDLVQQEVGKRKIRVVGIFQTAHSVATGLGSATLNDGKPIKTKMNWILNQGQTLSVWGYNLGTAPVATTVPEISVQGHANLWPR